MLQKTVKKFLGNHSTNAEKIKNEKKGEKKKCIVRRTLQKLEKFAAFPSKNTSRLKKILSSFISTNQV